MGLDNGFIVQGITRKDIPSFVILPFDNDYNDGIEIAYWRKCWGIRNAILDILHASNNDYHIPVEAEDIPAIIRGILPFFSKEYWDENANSIWEFEEVLDFGLIQQVINLKWLYSYMREHPEVTCYFYDSY